ncbi:beta-defensin 119-like [Cynocephalus volans]|uniref:beta-defensin 119-like n=1 Tax=Cynocephalus volans TaxID=110931 RepID=UPI002FC81D78
MSGGSERHGANRRAALRSCKAPHESFESRRRLLRCMGNIGICRPSCKKDEQPYLYCRNYQPCCLQSYMRISISGKNENSDWSYEKQWPKLP